MLQHWVPLFLSLEVQVGERIRQEPFEKLWWPMQRGSGAIHGLLGFPFSLSLREPSSLLP